MNKWSLVGRWTRGRRQMNQAKPAGRDYDQKGNETEQIEQDTRGRVPKKKEEEDVDNNMEASDQGEACKYRLV